MIIIKRFLIIIYIISLLITFSGCNSNNYTTLDQETMHLNNINLILKEELNNQLSSLNLINIYLNGVIELRNQPFEQIYYLGKISTAREQLDTLVSLQSINIKPIGEKAEYISLARTMYGISQTGNLLTTFVEKRSFEEEDYNVLGKVLERSKIITKELGELSNKQDLINAEYDFEKVDKLINEIKELLSK